MTTGFCLIRVTPHWLGSKPNSSCSKTLVRPRTVAFLPPTPPHPHATPPHHHTTRLCTDRKQLRQRDRARADVAGVRRRRWPPTHEDHVRVCTARGAARRDWWAKSSAASACAAPAPRQPPAQRQCRRADRASRSPRSPHRLVAYHGGRRDGAGLHALGPMFLPQNANRRSAAQHAPVYRA